MKASRSDWNTHESGFQTGAARATHDLGVAPLYALQAAAAHRQEEAPSGTWDRGYKAGYAWRVKVWLQS